MGQTKAGSGGQPGSSAPEGGRLPGGLDQSLLDPPPLLADSGTAQAAQPGRGGQAANQPLQRQQTATIDLSDASAKAAALPGLPLPQGALAAMAATLGAPYAPRALGPWAAREAIAAWLCSAGRPADCEDVVLTTSTSEAFAFLFKWAGRPGDAVVHMQPGYPLAGHLAELEGLRPVPLASEHIGGRWRLSLPSLQQALAAGARIVVLTNPNNPTGALLPPAEQAAVAALCNAHGALCIVDEVFAPYRHAEPALAAEPLPGCDCVVSLGGMSKAALLPQLKISWLVLGGSAAFRARARIAMTWVADAYLSVSMPSAAIVPALCAHMGRQQAQLRSRLRANKAWLEPFLLAEKLGALWPTEAGFVAPATLALSAAACRAARVQLQGGYLYDLPAPCSAVASLLLPPAELQAGWRRLAAAHRL